MITFITFNVSANTDQIDSLSSNEKIDSVITSNESIKFKSKDIKKGDTSDYIKLIQVKYGLNETGFYDDNVEKIIKDAQTKSGLTASGVLDETTWLKVYGVDRKTIEKLKEDSLRSWNSILDKHRDNESNKMIVVNVPSMKLYVYNRNGDKYDKLLESKVIIGRKSTQTPLEDFNIISLKFNPTWTPTSNMLKRNVYKGGKINVSWLKSHHLKVYDKDGNEYDYDQLSEIKEPRFTQELGEFNALGNLKFETSSKQDIYLHDTNERHLFSKNTRLYSSGCVRVQDYKDLASILTSKKVEQIDKGINKRETFYERLPQKVPVYFDYSQLVNINDGIHVFPDVYNKNN